MKKIEIATRSVQALKELLVEIISEPREFSGEIIIITALNSQGALTKLEDVHRGIVPCSLNTQKSAAERVIDNGYDTIDLLRRNAQQAIKDAAEIHKKSNKTTRAGQKKRIEELENDVALLEHQNLLLISLVQQLKSKLQHYANSNDEQLSANVKKDLVEVMAKIGFTNNANLIKAVLANE